MPRPTSQRSRARLGVTFARAALVTGTVLFAASGRAQAPSFTIDAALSAPFPSGLTAATTGGRIAWIFDAQGSRNIWVAEPAANGSFAARQVTRFAGDNGVEIGTLMWSSD